MRLANYCSNIRMKTTFMNMKNNSFDEEELSYLLKGLI